MKKTELTIIKDLTVIELSPEQKTIIKNISNDFNNLDLTSINIFKSYIDLFYNVDTTNKNQFFEIIKKEIELLKNDKNIKLKMNKFLNLAYDYNTFKIVTKLELLNIITIQKILSLYNKLNEIDSKKLKNAPIDFKENYIPLTKTFKNKLSKQYKKEDTKKDYLEKIEIALNDKIFIDALTPIETKNDFIAKSTDDLLKIVEQLEALNNKDLDFILEQLGAVRTID